MPPPENSGDTILISAAVPPVPLLGDVVWDAGGDHLGNARHGFSGPPSDPFLKSRIRMKFTKA
jgi:hypothetical protein